MNLYRNTYVEVNLKNIENNVKKIVKKYDEYEYFFGVVKADCYSHFGIETVKSIIEGGANYLATATLSEALEIRKEINNIPILCLGIIPIEFLGICKKENITITISSLKYYKQIKELNLKVRAHIKLNTGMNRLGFKDRLEVEEIITDIKNRNSKVELEGIYTHIYQTSNSEKYLDQIDKYEELTKNINLEDIKIKHISASTSIITYPKPKYINGCRMGIMMYGLVDDTNLNLESTFSLKSEIIEIQELKKGETVGYEGTYTAEENMKIGVVPIGYADGFIRKNKGNYVYINDKKYMIIGNICMDMLFIKINNNIKIHDEVILIKDIEHINEIAKYLDTISYEVLCNIGKRVPRIYKEE